jgi:predicted ATPase
MLRHVARAAPKHRILVLGTYRDVELDRQHPLTDALGILRREAEYECIALKGLDTAAVGTLLETAAEQHVDPALAQAIGAETDGNPFFIREVLMHLVEEGKLYRQDGRWQSRVSSTADLGIPEGVRQVIMRRLSRLPDNANRLLTAASAFNGGFRFDVVAEVAGLEEVVALDAVDHALAAQLLRSTEAADTYDFTHALIRHTLYNELSPSRQVRLHRQIAEAMEHRYADAAPAAAHGGIAEHAAEVAYQYHRSAALPGAERGVAHALAAVERAEAAYAPDEAASLLRTAIELIPSSDPRRPRLLGRLAQYLIRLNLPLIIVDTTGALVFFNEAAEPILGRRFEATGEIRRGEWTELFEPTRDDGSPVPIEEQPLFLANERRRPVHARAWIRALDGVRRQIEGIAFPLLGHDDRFLGAAGIFWEVE